MSNLVKSRGAFLNLLVRNPVELQTPSGATLPAVLELADIVS